MISRRGESRGRSSDPALESARVGRPPPRGNPDMPVCDGPRGGDHTRDQDRGRSLRLHLPRGRVPLRVRRGGGHLLRAGVARRTRSASRRGDLARWDSRGVRDRRASRCVPRAHRGMACGRSAASLGQRHRGDRDRGHRGRGLARAAGVRDRTDRTPVLGGRARDRRHGRHPGGDAAMGNRPSADHQQGRAQRVRRGRLDARRARPRRLAGRPALRGDDRVDRRRDRTLAGAGDPTPRPAGRDAAVRRSLPPVRPDDRSRPERR